jgi:Glycosyltransferase Family 4
MAKDLRIGIDADALRKPLAGVGKYVYHLAQELEFLLPEVSWFAYSRLSARALALPSPQWRLRREPLHILRRVPSFVWLKVCCPRLCAEDKLEIFWAGRTLHPHLGRDVKIVSTVHDLNHLVVAQTMQVQTRWSHRLWFERDVHSADRVVANSEGTAQRTRNALHHRRHR